MTLPRPARYFLASVVLLAALVSVVAVSAARRTQRELARQLEETGLTLANALAASSQNAIRANALMEEMISQRLLDNARLLDQLLRFRPPDPDWLRSVSATNRLLRVDLLDLEGRPYTWPAPPGPMMGGMAMRHQMGRMMGPPGAPEAHRAMMMYLWGPRWRRDLPDPSVPPTVRDRTYWEGTAFGVAVGARTFPGIIAVHADAEYVLNFRREIGVQRQVEDLGRRAGVEAVAILDPDLTVVAHSDPGRVGRKEPDEALRRLLEQGGIEQGGILTRFTSDDGAGSVLQIARPLARDGARPGLLQIRLSTAPMEAVWRRDRATAVVVALAVLGLGVLGLAVIFYTQHRHLAQITKLEAEVARRHRLATLGNMAAVVSHEVRNPLNAISMGLQRLRAEFRPTAEPADYDRVLELVGGEVRRLNALVEEFLALARPPVLKPEPVRLGDLLEEVVGLIEPEAHQTGIRIERCIPADLPPLIADRDRLKQVVLNLARNALEAMPDGGTLRLEAGRAPHTLMLTVADSGPGIPPEARDRIFEPYYTTKVKGLGLGLPLARQIVEAHGGTITVEPVDGGGTRFLVTLPLRDGVA